MQIVHNSEVFGFIRPSVDAHTLGVSVISNILSSCGYRVLIGNSNISEAVNEIQKLNKISLVVSWIRNNNITRLGFSYRLDSASAQLAFGRVLYQLKEKNMFLDQGGPLRQIYFAGLPEACTRIQKEYNDQIPVFFGDESPLETLKKMGIPDNKVPKTLTEGSADEDNRTLFATELIKSGKYNFEAPPNKGGYPEYGKFNDTLTKRIQTNRVSGRPPLMRVHVGPYNPDYREAKKEFKSWLKELTVNGFLDIVSIGSSQLSQSNFGEDWGNKPNGGGVPINSKKDLYEIWSASRPMLIRTYAGTRNIPEMARVYEEAINIAWHALSFWWFNKIDGRGPYDVKKNLSQHIETLRYIALTNKPFEPNIPHHFSFRGSDDYSYVLSAYLAAITAKNIGVRYFVLQTMLNTPKYTWGVQDLAKVRALLTLVRELEDKNFKVFLQPRAGLDYFSPDLEKAKIQLAAVTAMMDDIEPTNDLSPDIIHVVSYSEAVKLATPEIINESIQITLKALNQYRHQKKTGQMDNLIDYKEVQHRTNDIVSEVKIVRTLIEKHIHNPYSAEGLYTIFKKGIMPVPYLWEGRNEFKNAVKWKTAIIDGGVKVVDELGKPIRPSTRIKDVLETN